MIQSGEAGRDPTNLRLLISLWLYATIEREDSARELARQCRTSDAYKWPCSAANLNHHTLSGFRVTHAKALVGWLQKVLLVASTSGHQKQQDGKVSHGDRIAHLRPSRFGLDCRCDWG